MMAIIPLFCYPFIRCYFFLVAGGGFEPPSTGYEPVMLTIAPPRDYAVFLLLIIPSIYCIVKMVFCCIDFYSLRRVIF